jgi:serine/threonine protein phosphatase PrpC
VPDDPIARPSFSDIDAWGVTHRGKVRSSNQDHFFLGALARGVTVDRTSILTEGPVLHAERLASLDDGGSDNITVIIGRTLTAEHAEDAT